MVSTEVVESWEAGLQDLFARIAGRFYRIEPRRRAFGYVRGLLSPLERKNGWTLAEQCGDRSPNALQEMLYSPCWDPDAVRDDLRGYVVEQLGDRRGVLVGDDTGFVKKGSRSAGVQRQYSGTAGRTENCQIGVFLCYASDRGRALIDRELYLPVSWTGDRDRCRAAAVPEEVGFATKPQQMRMMVERAVAAGVPFAWFTADEAYGQNPGLRAWLEGQDIAYVMATRCDQQVACGLPTTTRVDTLIAALPTRAWNRRSAGDGAHGPRMLGGHSDPPPVRPWPPRLGAGQTLDQRRRDRLLRLLRAPRHPAARAGPRRRHPLGHRGVVPDRQERGRARPVPGPPLRRLVRPHHPGHDRRRVPGRHPRRRSRKRGQDSSAGTLVPLSSNEIRRLFVRIVQIGRTMIEHVLHWSGWRRRRQAQARAAHYRKRLKPP